MFLNPSTSCACSILLLPASLQDMSLFIRFLNPSTSCACSVLELPTSLPDMSLFIICLVKVSVDKHTMLIIFTFWHFYPKSGFVLQKLRSWTWLQNDITYIKLYFRSGSNLRLVKVSVVNHTMLIIFSNRYDIVPQTVAIVKNSCLREWTLFSAFLIFTNLSLCFCFLLVCETLLRCKYRFSFIVLRSIPVVVIRYEENKIYSIGF